MKIDQVPFDVTRWGELTVETAAGAAGETFSRTFRRGNLRVRMVEYSPGYLADHWCEKGHVLLVLSGELETELADGRRFVLPAGTSYQVADGDAPHRSSSPKGARLFIVD